MKPAPDRIYDTLKRYWGFTEFRPVQLEIIRSVLEGRDTLALMPTGGGKSLTYQVPTLAREGLCIVVTPLIALMKDQVDRLWARAVPAVAIHSGLSPRQIDIALDNCAYGDVKFLYVAPERLATEAFRLRVVRMNVQLIAVDEAHCISQWGYDFRPSYLRIAELREKLPGVPVLALTASATKTVADDIMRHLKFPEPHILRSSFARPNLSYSVRRTDDKNGQLLRLVRNVPGTGIVYVRTREGTEQIADLLRQEGTTAAAYHGGLGHAERSLRQEEWLSGKTRVMVATNAFGMGIDKADVRFVVHYAMCDSLESYYQEAGRAGRDGEPSRCTLLWNESDIVTRRRLLDNDYENERLTPEEQEIVRQSKRRLLDGMVGYCRTTDCLHRYMTRYFGQELSPNAGSTAGEDIAADSSQSGKCGACSNCESTFETIDVTRVAQAISRCVHDVGQRVGSGKIVKILRGSRAQDLAWLNPERMPTFGMLKDVNEARVRDVLSQMATDGYLSIAEGRMPIVMFGARAAETAAPDFHYEIKRVERKSEAAGSGRSGGVADTADSANVPGDALGSYIPDDDEESLFQKLRELRRTIAQEIGKPPYIVFSDKTLRDMARIKPVTNAQFLAVNGVGQHKLDLYGQRFMQAIASFNAGSAS